MGRATRLPQPVRPLVLAIRCALALGVTAGPGAVAEAAELPIPQAAFAALGRADHAVSGNTLNVVQHTDKAILDWQSFNVGRDASVHFRQPSAAAIALNRIHQADPSRILGTVSANGQIYLVNQNGFVFGKDARVDTNALLASSLAISEDTFQRGVTKVFDQDGRPALTGDGTLFRPGPDGKPVKVAIAVEAGARINAAPSGRIILAAPAVENRGTLSAPEGQVILAAAADKVYLQEVNGDPGMRGLLVEVGRGGEVSNLGQVLAEHGNASLIGFAVNQQGRISAKTAVRANGSIRLLAREGGTARRESDHWVLEAKRTTRSADSGDGLGTAARVTLGAGSVTEASPDLSDPATAVDGQAQEASRVEIMGREVTLQGGATLLSRAGQVKIAATERPDAPGQEGVRNGSRLTVEEGALIDVSGIKDVPVAMARNVVKVELRSQELRDAPLQKNGVLYGKTVSVDVRRGTRVADILGALERIVRTVAERSSAGGTLDLLSEGEVAIRPHALLDFSGGSVFYRPGYIKTTQLIQDRRIVDIGDADPNAHYDAILGEIEKTYRAWGITRRWKVPGPGGLGHYEAGYVEGKDPGRLNIAANGLSLEGTLRAGAVNGIHQRESARAVAGGQLSIDLARTPASVQPVVFTDTPGLPLPAADPAPLLLPGNFMMASGLGSARIATAGTVAVAPGTTLQLPDGGALSLRGGEVKVDGALKGTGASVDIASQLSGATQGRLSGAVELGATARIDVSGRWVNDAPDAWTAPYAPRVFSDGGQVSLAAEGTLRLAADSLIDVSGGGWRPGNTEVRAGEAGSIALAAVAPQGSNLVLEGTLTGYALSGGQGGRLSLSSAEVLIGDSGAQPPVDGVGAGPLFLTPDFFNRGGFQQYAITSNASGVRVLAGTALQVQAENRLLDGSYTRRVTGSDLKDFSQVALLPEIARNPASLTLTLQRTANTSRADAAVRLEAGAAIDAGAKGSVSLVSDSSCFVDGSIAAPAGTIALQVTKPAVSDPGFLADQGIWLGSLASLNAAGTALTVSQPSGQIRGDVLPGGTVSLHADRGFVNVLKGARIDVSGTAAAVDVPRESPGASGVLQRRVIPSDGGAIDLRAAEGMQLRGEFKAAPGAGAGAAGGSLSLELNTLTRNEPDPPTPGQQPFPTVPSVIRVTGAEVATGSDLAMGSPVPAAAFGLALLPQSLVEQGGFADLSLRSGDRLEFQGQVQLHTARSITLDAPVLAAGSTAGSPTSVAMTTGYLALGSTQNRPGGRAPTTGTAALSANAQLIDLVGSSVLSGFAKADLASQGDIRVVGIRTAQEQRDFTGEFLLAGNLTLQADQLYPTTLTDFRIALQNAPAAALTVLPDSAPGAVYSAAGKLSLEAPTIVQGGVVKAPLGQLNLTATGSLRLAPGSVTSNAGDGVLVPFGRTQGGLDWIYPLGTQNLVYAAGSGGNALPPPEKLMNLAGGRVDLASTARVDSSGGGDLFAFEFIPGPGGSVDVLDAGAAKQHYAVLPGFTGAFAPYDPLEFPSAGLRAGDSVHLAGGGGLAAGDYVLLPAHYALLPGAYLVSEEPGSGDFIPGSRSRNGLGDVVVAGYRKVAGTDLRQSRWSGFSITPGAVVKTRAEYDESRGQDFFRDQAARLRVAAPSLPGDAGRIHLRADSALSLAGQVTAQPGKAGLGGQIDIEAQALAIVSASGSERAAAGVVALTDAQINRLQVASVLLGGVRERTESATLLTPRAQTVSVGRGADVRGPELMLVARDAVRVEEGAQVSGSGKGGTAARQPLLVQGDGALLRVSAGAQVDVQRRGVSGAGGNLSIAAGAVLAADGSMNLDASGSGELRGSLAMAGGSLSLAARRIGLGELPADNGELVLGAPLLQSLALDELILTSPQAIGVSGAFGAQLGRLAWQAPGLAGFGSRGQTATIRADTVVLSNPGGALSTRTGTGNGNLEVSARQITLGEGSYDLSGFSRGSLRADERVMGSGSGSLQSTADLAITAPLWTAAAGADTRIVAADHTVAIAGRGAGAAEGTPRLGGRLAVEAARIDFAGNIVLPSGQVDLSAASGDVTLAAGSVIDVAGRTLASGGSEIRTDGGRIGLNATQGNVSLNPGAKLDVSGERGGKLEVAAPNGAFVFAGEASANGRSAGGSFSLVQATAPGGGWSGLLGKLQGAGFADSLVLRVRQGDLELGAGDRLLGREISLTADGGALRIAGDVAAQGTNARLNLLAGEALSLASTARLSARGMAGKAGQVNLESGVGGIVLQPGARIDVSAADTGTPAGSVQLVAPRTVDEVAVTGDLRQAVSGAGQITVTAQRRYVHNGSIGADDIRAWETDTLAYMSHAAAVEQRLGIPGGLRPGIHVVSDGDLSLAGTGWDLSGQRYQGRPGVLSLAAAGSLTLEGSLSDGFSAYDAAGIDLSALLGPGAAMPVKDLQLPGLSWSYRLSAGGDVSIAPGASVRTGTGDISVSAGRDFLLSDDSASLYTAGRPADTGRYGSFKPSYVAFGFFGEYPVDGGDVQITAGRDVRGARSGQFFEDWFVQSGNWSHAATHAGQRPTAWAIALGQVDSRFDGQPLQAPRFRQNVGALGGGDVRVQAGRDVVDLSVMLPTTGKQTGQVARPERPADAEFVSNQVALSAGGDLHLSAGGDVQGGVFYVGRGAGAIVAGGSLSAGAGDAPVLAVGDSRFEVRAGQDIALGTVLNPTVVAGADSASYFFTYGERSAVHLQALGGNVTLDNDVQGLLRSLNSRRSPADALEVSGAALKAFSVYPAALDVQALQGNIEIDHSFVLFPSASGGLTLRAGQDIGTGTDGANIAVLQSDADVALLPSVAYPAVSFVDASQRLDAYGPAALTRATVPTHGSEAEPVRISAGGGLVARDPILFSLATPLDLQAGGDMRDVSFKLQHEGYRISSLQVGGELSFTAPRDAAGNLLNLVRGIDVSGPGELWISAGGSVDLGTSQGIYSLGNTFNPALPEQGASISLLVGMQSQADFDGFARRYDPRAGAYRKALLAYLQRRDGTLSEATAPAAYDQLSAAERREALLAVFFAELREAAIKAAASGRKKDYDAGFAAIQSLFPGQGDGQTYAGDLSLYFSRIQTVDGGDINLLVPGGEVNAGLAVSFSGAKASSELGIVVQREGAINAFVDGNFQVNQSRVFALDGGDITLWSSNGNIDAGRGAKSAIAVPPPLISFDSQGNLRVEYPPVVSGSGIRTAATSPDREPGDVILAAPRGVVDAGEAGIGGNNVTIAANAVIGASNINVSGIASGLPASGLAVVPVPAGAANAAASAVQAAQQASLASASAADAMRQAPRSAPALNRLDVDVIGFGDCSIKDVREGKVGCGA